MFDPATDIALMLALAAFVAGFINSIAGGGGLITIPGAFARRLQPCRGAWDQQAAGVVRLGLGDDCLCVEGLGRLRRQLPAAAMAFVASVVGALVATILPGDLLRLGFPSFWLPSLFILPSNGNMIAMISMP